MCVWMPPVIIHSQPRYIIHIYTVYMCVETEYGGAAKGYKDLQGFVGFMWPIIWDTVKWIPEIV